MTDPSEVVPGPASGHVRARMKSQARRDTAPELALRRELWRRGLRGYRLDWRLPFDRRRRADIAWPGRRIAVFVDGCFWHGCPDHFTLPKTNTEWWRDKIAANSRRDRTTNDQLRKHDWIPVRIWEHEGGAAGADRIERIWSAP